MTIKINIIFMRKSDERINQIDKYRSICNNGILNELKSKSIK